jgi:hypothetical protein
MKKLNIPCFYEYDPIGLSVMRITPDTLEKSLKVPPFFSDSNQNQE